jgi:hypothetical protein
MKRLLLSTTLILGTLTGVKGSDAHPSIQTTLFQLDQPSPTMLVVHSNYATLKAATIAHVQGVTDATFANTEATIYGILKSLTKKNPDVDILQTSITTSALVLSLIAYHLTNETPRIQKGLVPITGALITRTVVDYITQAGINQFEFFRTWARTTACCMVFTYLILAITYEANHSIENTPAPLWPITGGIALKFLSPLLQFENPLTLDKIRATWGTLLSDPEKIHCLSGILAQAFLRKGITSESEMKSHIENMLENKTDFQGLLSLFP